jgi:MFS family permease
MSVRPRADVPPIDQTGEIAPVPLRLLRGRRLPRAVRALEFPDFRLLWAGAVVSNAGTHMQVAAIAWVVAVLTHSALRVTLISFIGMLPLLVLSPIGGALADRMPRRRMLRVTLTLQMSQAFLLFALWQSHVASYWVLFAMALANGAISGISAPAWQAYVPSLVPRRALQNAVMLNSAQFNLAKAIGPMSAGILLAHLGAGLCFLVNALSYLGLLAPVLFIRAREPARPPQHRPGYWREFAEGVRYVRSERGISTGMMTNAVIVMVGSPIVQGGLISIIALKFFHVGAAAYGVLAGALGVGAIIGAVIVGQNDGKVRPSKVVTVALAIYVVAIGTLALAPHIAVGIAALVVMGGSFLAIVSSTNSAIQLICEERLRGRVMAFWLATFGAVFPPSVLIQGALADAIGIRSVVFIDAALIACYAVFVTTRRRLTSLDPPEWERETAHAR